MESGDPFNLICLDIMMPEMNGQEVLRQIREKENAMGIPACDRVKIVMTTALSEQIQTATDDQHQYDAYLTKPIGKAKLLEELRRLKLIP
jgi:two-component system, chemotaxis family, chemotaxis protein CheY